MTDAAHDLAWRRFTPAQRAARFAVYLAIVAGIVVSIQSVEVIPEFLADAAKSRLDIDPVTGTELENLVRGLFKLSPSMINKLKTILLPS